MTRLALLALLILPGCDALPQDPDGTLHRIRTARVLRIGIDHHPPPPAAQTLIATIARETGATPRLSRGTIDPLIVALDEDALDLVIAPVAKRTPWKTQVAMAPPIAAGGSGDARIEWRAMVKNGENRWLVLVEHASRPLAPADVR